MVVKYCLDTYALMEITEGNPNFTKFLNKNFMITDITLAEFYSVLLRDKNEKTADYWFNKLGPFSKQVDLFTLISAIKFRHEKRKQKISFFDAVGYAFSIQNNLKFVTGDKEFKNLPNVEFKK